MGNHVDFSKMEFNAKDKYAPSKGINSGFDSEALIKSRIEHKNKPIYVKQEKIDERLKQIDGLQNFQSMIENSLNSIKESNDGLLNYLDKKIVKSSDNSQYIEINTHDNNNDFFYKFEDIQLSKPCIVQTKKIALNKDITNKAGDPDNFIALGKMLINGQDFEIEASDNIEKLREKLNNLNDISADIIKVSQDKYSLLITIEDGTDINVQPPTNPLDVDGSTEFMASITTVSSTSKASFKFQGITIKGNKNNDIEVIPNKLSVNLKQSYSSSVNIYTATINNEKAIEKINSFIVNYNKLNDFIVLQNHRDSSGLLSEEAVLNTNPFFQEIAYKIKHLLDLKCYHKAGILQDRNGKLQFEQQEYEKYYQANKNDLTKFIDDTKALNDELQNLYDQGFLIEIYNLQTDNNNENTEIAQIMEKNKKEENALRRKYADLEKKLGDLDITMDLIEQDFQYRTSRN